MLHVRDEAWTDVVGYENLYSVSTFGGIYDKLNRKPKKTQVSKATGYERVALTDANKKQKMFSVHRLVAQHFINNPENKPQVHHIDEVRTNNTVENLEWVTPAENAASRSEKSKQRFRETYAANKKRREKIAF